MNTIANSREKPGAIFHFTCKVHGRSTGGNAVKLAAYRAGVRLKAETTGRIHNYSRKKEVLWSHILAPENAPAWATDRQALWNAVDRIEHRCDAQLAREVEIALPLSLSPPVHCELLREWVSETFVAAGMVADVCYHAKRGNPSIAALMGFSASILIHPWVPGAETGMIVLVGASGRGKTTAMRAIASMISEPSKPSKPGSYIMSFRTTDNGLEGRLEAKNHCFSLIDEVGASSSAMNFTALVYMIANGIGRLRMNADSTARETKTWTTQTVATGEESIASKINASGQAERGGILFRVIDLHLEGVPFWEHLESQVRDGSTGDYSEICKEYGPGAVTATQVMDTVFAGLEQHHGHAWWEMVERMLGDEYRGMAADRLVAWKKAFTSKLDDRSEIIVHRRSIHLASAMAGLELILDNLGDELPATERQSIIDSAASWVENHLWRAGLPEGVVTEEGALYERVIEKIAMNPGRFYYPASDEKPRSFKEYWGVNYGGCGVTIFIAGLKDMCAEMGEDYKRVRHALVSQSDDKKWTESNNRPAPGAAPMRGLCSPETFRLLGYGYRA